MALPKLKNLSLRFLSALTGESLKAILDNQRALEGLDISGCFGMDLGCLTKLRGNSVLRCILLEYLLIKSDNIKALHESKITTLSVFCNHYSLFANSIIDSKTVNRTHVEAIKSLQTLTHLNIQDCPEVTEQGKHTLSHLLILLLRSV